MREIAISDIHGSGQEFLTLLEMIEPLAPDDKLILLGDYFDRGKESKLVFKLLQRLKLSYGEQVIFLVGNHDDMMFHHFGLGSTNPEYDPRPVYDQWFSKEVGGKETLKSFGNLEDLRIAAKWLKRNTVLCYETEHAVYVHAGLYAGERTPENVMIWMRNLHVMPPQRKLLVVGHTIITTLVRDGYAPKGSKAPYYDSLRNFINIDGGAVFFHNVPHLAYDVANNIAYYSDGRIITDAISKPPKP